MQSTINFEKVIEPLSFQMMNTDVICHYYYKFKNMLRWPMEVKRSLWEIMLKITERKL